MWLFNCVGSRVSISFKYTYESCPLSLADCNRLITTAARSPANSLPTNNQFLCLWAAAYNCKNRLFVGSEQAGERAAVMLSLIESAKLNGHDPWAYLEEVFEHLPTLKNRDLESLLPHSWKPADKAQAPAVPAAPPR